MKLLSQISIFLILRLKLKSRLKNSHKIQHLQDKTELGVHYTDDKLKKVSISGAFMALHSRNV